LSERNSHRGFIAAGIVAVALVVGGVTLIALTRSSAVRGEARRRDHLVALGPHVRVVSVGRSPPERDLTVEADAQPYATVTLYAKISGYLRSITVDKGDRVKKGQVVAEIESPELDLQDVAAAADARNKRSTAERDKSLVGPGVVSTQEYDTAVANADVAEASQKSLSRQRGYETLRAPFDGTVTARYADVGALVQSAASAQTSALPVVTIAQIDTLRIYAYLAQREAAFVHEGDEAEVTLAERPGTALPAKVTRLSHELDPKTRTMLVEIDLDNRQQLIVPGSFVRVKFKVPVPSLLEVPVAALVLRGTAPFVGVVASDNRVHFRPVKIADDDGSRARILEGLHGDERIALNLGEEVAEDGLVQPLPEEAPRVPTPR
jgi:membrane fusion protein (multidrug efflux system)